MSASFITPGHVRAFQAVTSQLYGEVTLASCRINGDPGVAIVLLDAVGEGKIAVMPLFVAITPSMEIVFEGEQQGGSSGGPRREFQSAKEPSIPCLRRGGRQQRVVTARCCFLHCRTLPRFPTCHPAPER